MTKPQKYRGYTIRRTYAGLSVERPSGAHLKTVPDYQSAVVCVDMDIVLFEALAA